jgi:hypothetical protein
MNRKLYISDLKNGGDFYIFPTGVVLVLCHCGFLIWKQEAIMNYVCIRCYRNYIDE